MRATSVLDSNVLHAWIDCLFPHGWIDCLFPFHVLFFLCCRNLFLLRWKCTKKILRHHMQQASVFGRFPHHDEMLLHNLWSFVCISTVRMTQAAGISRSWRIDLFLAPKYELLQSNSCLLGCGRVMQSQAEFHLSWVYIFSAMLSSLETWANHDRYRLRPRTPT